jgi:Family of unknown function (DUF6893)
VKTAQSIFKNALGITGVVIAGYMLVTAIPDIVRYIRISRM